MMPTALSIDKELLRRYYLKNGFADIEMSPPKLSRRRWREFRSSIHAQRGPALQHRRCGCEYRQFQPRSRAPARRGEDRRWRSYDASKVDKSVENMTLEASRQGYVFASVEPNSPPRLRSRLDEPQLQHDEGTRAYMERIEIIGNRRTLRRRGSPRTADFRRRRLNRTLVERARRRLTALDFFDKIDFREEEGSAPDKVVLFVDLVEKSTGKIASRSAIPRPKSRWRRRRSPNATCSAGASTCKLNTQLPASSASRWISASPNPISWACRFPRASTCSPPARTTPTISSYKSEQVGGALRTGFDLDEYSSLDFKYYVARRKTTGIDLDAPLPPSLPRKARTGNRRSAPPTPGTILTTPNIPTTGFRGQLDGEVAGLGGNVYLPPRSARPGTSSGLRRSWSSSSKAMPATWSRLAARMCRCRTASSMALTLSAASPSRALARARSTAPTGNATRSAARPMRIGTVEVNFPVGLPEGWGISGTVFSDFGTLFNAPEMTVWRGAGHAPAAPPPDCTCSTAWFPRFDRRRPHLAVAVRPAALRPRLSAAQGGLRREGMVPLHDRNAVLMPDERNPLPLASQRT